MVAEPASVKWALGSAPLLPSPLCPPPPAFPKALALGSEGQLLPSISAAIWQDQITLLSLPLNRVSSQPLKIHAEFLPWPELTLTPGGHSTHPAQYQCISQGVSSMSARPSLHWVSRSWCELTQIRCFHSFILHLALLWKGFLQLTEM